MVTEKQKQFRKLLETASSSHNIIDVFSDAVHVMALSIWSPFAGKERAAVEDDFSRTKAKYSDNEFAAITSAFALLAESLEDRREEFLGNVLEDIGANNAHNGQFLTPQPVARLMARVAGNGKDVENHKPGEFIFLHDPACGASVLTIEQGEELLSKGIRQGDIIIDVGDVDRRAVDMSYVELSMLGYAAVVRHRNGLSMQDYSSPMFTPGWFLHGIPMRMFARNTAEISRIKPKTEAAKTREIVPESVSVAGAENANDELAREPYTDEQDCREAGPSAHVKQMEMCL